VESFGILCVDEEDDAVYFWEVVLPKTTGWGRCEMRGRRGEGDGGAGERRLAGSRRGGGARLTLLVSSKVVRRELDVSNSQLLGSYKEQSGRHRVSNSSRSSAPSQQYALG
jgi:hypothetical protein